MGNWVLGVLMSGGGERLPDWLSVCRCVCVCVDVRVRRGIHPLEDFSPRRKTTYPCEISRHQGRGEEDECEDARRSPGREWVLIKNSARENRHYRPFFRWLVAALRRNYGTNGLRTLLNGVKRSGILSWRRVQSFSKRPKNQREGEERGAKKTPCCLLLLSPHSNFIAELENASFTHQEVIIIIVTAPVWRYLYSLEAKVQVDRGTRSLGKFREAGSLCFGNIFLFIVHTIPVGGDLGGLRAQGCSARPTAISQEQRGGFTCKLTQFGQKPLHNSPLLWPTDAAVMSLGAERRMETRLKKLEDMIRDPRSAINLESLLVSQVGYTS